MGTYQRLTFFNGYPLSFLSALVLHGLLLGVVVYLQSRPPALPLNLEGPTTVRALFIDENPQLVTRRRQEAAEQRAAEEAREKAEAEAARQALVERQTLEEAARLAQLQREQRQREAEAEQLRLQQEAEAEAQQQDELPGSRSETELVQSASAMVERYVRQQWSRPPSARLGMETVLRIQMLPTGQVTDVTVVSSSGNRAFDRSAEEAIRRAAPFTELQQLPIRLFNGHFRTLTFTFRPEDLLN